MYGFYKTTLVASLIAACSILLTSAITAEPRSTPQKGQLDSIVLPTSSKGILSQCGDYFTFNPDSNKYGVIPNDYDGSIPLHKMTIPVYGYITSKPFDVDKANKLKQGENPYTPDEIHRALWNGDTFIWVSKSLPSTSYDFVKSYVTEWNKAHEKKLIVLTWPGKNIAWKGKEDIPLGRQFAFSSWNISQSCLSFSEDAFEEFMQQSDALNIGRDMKTLPAVRKPH
jgi:hypothetical protein